MFYSRSRVVGYEIKVMTRVKCVVSVLMYGWDGYKKAVNYENCASSIFLFYFVNSCVLIFRKLYFVNNNSVIANSSSPSVVINAYVFSV